MFPNLKPLPLQDVLLDPEFLYPFIGYGILQLMAYHLIVRMLPSVFSTAKQKSWLLSFFISAIIPIGTSSIVHAFVLDEANFDPSNDSYTRTLSSVFVSFLAFDMIIGTVYYPSHIQALTGYIHHLIYIAVAIDFLRHNAIGAFATLGIMEVPTWVLAIGNISSSFRSDYLFGLTFFLTRIVYHLFLIYKLYIMFPDNTFYLYLLISFPVHFMWFRSWTRKYMFSKHSKKE